jgi:predicted metalloprotease
LAQTATGPFYCPGDEKVYLDLSFFNELKNQLGASGEFAQAYVIAHEIGHHVQKIVGTEQKVRQEVGSNPKMRNAISVRVELQADCYAGVWANSTQRRDLLETGDVASAMNAAAAVGDDHLQKMETGRVMPDKFTHGTSAQRTYWFQQGFTAGSPTACDTFSSSQ